MSPYVTFQVKNLYGSSAVTAKRSEKTMVNAVANEALAAISWWKQENEERYFWRGLFLYICLSHYRVMETARIKKS